jgi:Protein of unknown function (DUF4232)
MRVARLLALSPLTIALIAAVSACGSSGHTAVSDGGPHFAPRCRGYQLKLKGGRDGVAAGTAVRDFALIDESRRVCTVAGWPDVGLAVGRRRLVAPRVTREGFGMGRAAQLITLRPGGAASFRIAGSDGTGTGLQTCKTVRTLVVRPQGGRGWVSLRKGLSYFCAPYRLYVGPLVPGLLSNRSGL